LQIWIEGKDLGRKLVDVNQWMKKRTRKGYVSERNRRGKKNWKKNLKGLRFIANGKFK